jgi:hypothetical protein
VGFWLHRYLVELADDSEQLVELGIDAANVNDLIPHVRSR